ncbi:hypothetical protein GCM10010435_72780 [Winogradskya consettensis]|uniref:Uncharacterized protein n=1 Tax=Winogradskya consettensis TaxID=113560 RepID=A0A919VYV2_9ACTN|nr:hypothetical protein [Actinoplanes consettensis]GIM83660.1 hypothetical protein Aco04nite_87670 [Actinoplanes consettensis]
MRRYNCRCGKKRYRNEQAALNAAARDQDTHGEEPAVYRCPGGLAWHLSAHGFTPEALPTVGRRLAYALLKGGVIKLDDFARPRRVRQCAQQMIGLRLALPTDADGLRAGDRTGLSRVVQIGLDGYAEEQSRPPAT